MYFKDNNNEGERFGYLIRNELPDVSYEVNPTLHEPKAKNNMAVVIVIVVVIIVIIVGGIVGFYVWLQVKRHGSRNGSRQLKNTAKVYVFAFVHCLLENVGKFGKHAAESRCDGGAVSGLTLNEKGIIENSYDFAASLNVDHQVVVGVIKSLETDLVIKTEQLSQQFWELSDEALTVIKEGSPGRMWRRPNSPLQRSVFSNAFPPRAFPTKI